MKRVMVATDLSERSDRALERAVHLAWETGARLSVLHVIDDELPSRLRRLQEEAADESLREHLASLEHHDDIQAEVLVRSGQGPEEILHAASARGAELLILGLHRRRGLTDWFRGTTVERIVRNVHIPVLVVRNRVSGPYRSSIVGVDFSLSSRSAVVCSRSVAPSAEMHLVHAYEKPFKGFLTGVDTTREYRDQQARQFDQVVDRELAILRNTIDSDEPAVHRVLREGSPQQVLHMMVSEVRADLLVLGTHGRAGAARAIIGSVAEAFLVDPPCDVLTIKAW